MNKRKIYVGLLVFGILFFLNVIGVWHKGQFQIQQASADSCVMPDNCADVGPSESGTFFCTMTTDQLQNNGNNYCGSPTPTPTPTQTSTLTQTPESYYTGIGEVDGNGNCPRSNDPADIAAIAEILGPVCDSNYCISYYGGAIYYGDQQDGSAPPIQVWGTRLRIYSADDQVGTNLQFQGYVGDGSYSEAQDAGFPFVLNSGGYYPSALAAEDVGFNFPSLQLAVSGCSYIYVTADDIYGGFCGDNTGTELTILQPGICAPPPSSTPTPIPDDNGPIPPSDPAPLPPNPESLICQQCTKNPVATAYGMKMDHVTDFSVPGKGGLDFTFERLFTDFRPVKDEILGYGWTHNWDVHVAFNGGNAVVRFADGQDHQFTQVSASEYDSMNGFPYTLLLKRGVWSLVGRDGKHYDFDSQGRLSLLEDRFGNAITLAYDPTSGLLSSITDTGGRIYNLSYDPNTGWMNALTFASPVSGVTWTLSYQQTDGYLTGITGPGSNGSYAAEYSYDPVYGNMLTKDDPHASLGLRNMRYVYDSGGRVIQEVRVQDSGADDSAATAYTYAYQNNSDGSEQVVETVDGQTQTINYNAALQWASTTINGSTSNLAWDSLNQGLTSKSDYLGNVTQYTYYHGGEPGYVGKNRSEVMSETDPTGLATQYQYDGYGFGVPIKITRTDNNTGKVSLYQAQVDGEGRVVSANQDGVVTNYSYGASGFGQWTSSTDALGNVVTRQFNTQGQVASVSNPGARLSTQFTYDSLGRLLTALDLATDRLSTYTYDGAGNVLEIKDTGDGGSSQENFVYDDQGKLLSHTDRAGQTTSYSYSSDGDEHLTGVTEPGGLGSKVITYDNNGNPASMVESGPAPLGNWERNTTYQYDLIGTAGTPGLLRYLTVNGANVGGTTENLTTEYRYDADSRITDVLDPLGGHTVFAYDAGNRVISQTQGLGSPAARTANYTFDAFGNRTSITDGKGQTTNFTYNAQQSLSAELPPSGPEIQYAYNADNLLKQKTDRLEHVWQTGYDAADRPVTETFLNAKGSTIQEALTYGSIGAGTDKITSATDATGGEQYTYGHLGLVTSRTVTQVKRKLNYSYDAAWRVSGVQLSATDNSASVVTEAYTYDFLNRITQYTDWFGNQINYAYNPDGKVAEIAYNALESSGKFNPVAVGRFTYDNAGRLLQVQYRQSASPTGNVIAESDYTYDAAGNRLSRADLASQASFSYDGVYELTGDSNTADVRGAQTFAYDLAGNRNQQTLGTQTLSYSTPNNLNRLASTGTSSFQYDAEGNRTQFSGVSGTSSYVYDGKNRLSQVTLPNGTVITYAYNWQNKLVSRTKGSEVRTYLYGKGTQVLEETLNGKRYALYGWGPDGLVSRTDANGQSLFYLKDAQGKIMALVDTQDNVVKDNQYSAFGEDLSGKDAVNPFRFVGGLGGRKDDDTGLVYFWNRWYDPSVGRWISEDPIRQAGGLNLYDYLENQPLLGADLMGWCDIVPGGMDPSSDTYMNQTAIGVYTNPDEPPAAILGPIPPQADAALEELQISYDFHSQEQDPVVRDNPDFWLPLVVAGAESQGANILESIINDYNSWVDPTPTPTASPATSPTPGSLTF